MNCNHCDKPTITPATDMCDECYLAGHSSMDSCELCRSEARETVERLNKAEVE